MKGVSSEMRKYFSSVSTENISSDLSSYFLLVTALLVPDVGEAVEVIRLSMDLPLWAVEDIEGTGWGCSSCLLEVRKIGS